MRECYLLQPDFSLFEIRIFLIPDTYSVSAISVNRVGLFELRIAGCQVCSSSISLRIKVLGTYLC